MSYIVIDYLMRPTLRQLEYIVTVARLGRFGLAAETLNVSQPSLSAQIAEAERELGARLFERSRASVQPTATGTEVIRRAQNILREVEDLRAAVSGGVPFGGRLRLGVLPSIGPYLLPRVVAAIHRAQPDLRVIVREESTQHLEQGLTAGRLDLIISTPEDHPNTRQTRLFNEKLWVAVARDDPLSQATGPVRAESLSGRIFLTLDRRHRLSRIVYALASDCGGIVSDEYEGTSLDSIRLMAASGAGIAIMPELYAMQHKDRKTEVAIRPLAIAAANRNISLLQRASDSDPTGLDLISGALLSEVKSLGLS
ncbi:hydrogen peroxide-inducible genes activator [Ruegeria sp. 2205SS24-7]|uniref:hydrogen peroxide-inducible genes activator n=1 Tax=Ruegeria discodermiae TaxID=3064389 RepID=UPI00274212BF|nr:hydrogen peroxide-inducible genes activator [Ruegeria sp. 2205SS24-7]MDP5217162.1 hydrogen peroxide-inducible genes activator [Ruegeria sp. 2205SS24-7]